MVVLVHVHQEAHAHAASDESGVRRPPDHGREHDAVDERIAPLLQLSQPGAIGISVGKRSLDHDVDESSRCIAPSRGLKPRILLGILKLRAEHVVNQAPKLSALKFATALKCAQIVGRHAVWPESVDEIGGKAPGKNVIGWWLRQTGSDLHDVLRSAHGVECPPRSGGSGVFVPVELLDLIAVCTSGTSKCRSCQ